ncbi:hypothetical protein AF335_20350 [Streptomyces eurocidicus]|uniref:Uncharacterized protein n=1 Tax=Streptomyces eurocidicus TaxID=66423 RepID=A0A2N8NTK3_STREU|nr:hypothetical protein AF335_20350 [Streptomyces eurocidicus]
MCPPGSFGCVPLSALVFFVREDVRADEEAGCPEVGEVVDDGGFGVGLWGGEVRCGRGVGVAEVGGAVPAGGREDQGP